MNNSQHNTRLNATLLALCHDLDSQIQFFNPVELTHIKNSEIRFQPHYGISNNTAIFIHRNQLKHHGFYYFLQNKLLRHPNDMNFWYTMALIYLIVIQRWRQIEGGFYTVKKQAKIRFSSRPEILFKLLLLDTRGITNENPTDTDTGGVLFFSCDGV